MKGSVGAARHDVMKKLCFSLIVLMLVFGSVSAIAAPNSVNGWDAGNESGLLAITNPQYTTSSVNGNCYVISGYCKSGASVSVYKLSASGSYDMIIAPAAVGASGIFFRSVTLASGKNSFVVRAQVGDKYQQSRFDIFCFGFNKIY